MIWSANTWTLAQIFSAGLTLAGAISAADQIIGRAVLKDYGETVNAIGGTGGGTQEMDETTREQLKALGYLQ